MFKVAVILLCMMSLSRADDQCLLSSSETKESSARYLLYTVNYGEGFNLRRDVYIRLANLIVKLNKQSQDQHWVLVLPSWHGLYHWRRSRNASPQPLPWGEFFDVASLNSYIPVIELDQYIAEVGRSVQSVLVLQHYDEGWSSHWEEKHEERPCIESHQFRQKGSVWEGTVSGRLLQAGDVACLSVQGTAGSLATFLQDTPGNSVLLGRSETVLHDHFTGPMFWRARRSMRFAAPLQARALHFRRTTLNSTNREDSTTMPQDWRDEQPRSSPAIGGPYLAVHLRRRDFVRAKPGEVPPTLQHAALQLRQLLVKLKLQHLFLATDATKEEVSELVLLLQPFTIVHYSSTEDSSSLGDGHLAIIDQIITSHARHFIGSHESTFSYRIQEEREILGFAADTTYNRLCGTNSECTQPSKWTIEY